MAKAAEAGTTLAIEVSLRYRVTRPMDVLVQIEAAALDDQLCEMCHLDVGPAGPVAPVAAEGGIGTRFWLRAETGIACDYRARVRVFRAVSALEGLSSSDVSDLPGAAVGYLMPSLYCPWDAFELFVNSEFAGLCGGTRVAAMRDWVAREIVYVSGSSGAETTALDTFAARQGICRDFAHVLIAFCRASGIPARFVSVYAPDVLPPDFHAVAEVFLDGRWHLVDPTGMARAEDIVRIGVGLDAAGVAFLTSFGPVEFGAQSVSVSRLG